MAQYTPKELGFIDEVSKGKHTVGQHYGQSRKGHCAKKAQPFVWGRHTSTVGLLMLQGFVSGTVVKGSHTKASFLQWMEFSVVHVYLSWALFLLIVHD
jgi:hypothetical protein